MTDIQKTGSKGRQKYSASRIDRHFMLYQSALSATSRCGRRILPEGGRHGPTQFMLNKGPCTEGRGECHASPGNLLGGKYPLTLGSLRDRPLAHSLIDTSLAFGCSATTEICGIADRKRRWQQVTPHHCHVTMSNAWGLWGILSAHYLISVRCCAPRQSG